MSGRKRNRCIDYDSEGKIILLPLQIPAEFREPRQTSNQREKAVPLANNNSNDKPIKEPKVRKLDHNVRKELFKMPNASKGSNKSNKVNSKTVTAADARPLDSKISKPRNGYKALKKVEIKNEVETNSKELHNMSQDSAEFLALEKSFQTPKPKRGHVLPPLVLCDLENTNLSAQKTSTGNKLSDQVNDLRKLIEDGDKEFRVLEEVMTSFKQKQSVIRMKMSELLDAIERQNDESANKENSSSGSKPLRRSQRLHPENSSGKTALVVSPVISKGVDLRRTTLTRNLLNDVQNLTPRAQKAEFLYKSIRTNITLATPTYRNVQEQYLLLQCTPRANKMQM